MKRPVDFFSGVMIVIFSMVLFGMTGRLPGESAMFPRILAGIMGFLGLLLCVSALKAHERQASIESFRNMDVWKGYLLITAYVIAMSSIGFFVSTAFFVIVFMYLNKERSVIRIGATALILNVFIYLVFVAQLNVPLPNGFLF